MSGVWLGMSVEQLDPDRFRIHERSIRERLCRFPVEFDVWNFTEAEYELDIAFTHSLDVDSEAIIAQINDCFWSHAVFRHKRDARGLEDSKLHRMTWRDDPN